MCNMPHKAVGGKNKCRLLRDCVRIGQAALLSVDIGAGAAVLGRCRTSADMQQRMTMEAVLEKSQKKGFAKSRTKGYLSNWGLAGGTLATEPA